MFLSYHHRCQTFHPSRGLSQSEANQGSLCCDIMVWDKALKWLTSYWYTQDIDYVAVSASGVFYADSLTRNCDLFTSRRSGRAVAVCLLPVFEETAESERPKFENRLQHEDDCENVVADFQCFIEHLQRKRARTRVIKKRVITAEDVILMLF